MSGDDEWSALRAFTPARLAQGRAGNALPTSRLLEFQLAHARARDAVWAPFDPAKIASDLAGFESIAVETNAANRHAYLMNPSLGRTLPPASASKLTRGPYDAVLVIADGLSPSAIHAHGAALANIVLSRAPHRWAPAIIVTNGRVAIGDEIAAALGASLAVVMIGERPGLSAADSIGLYLTFAPKPGISTDADRNCISNVRPEGLPLADAAHRLAWLMDRAIAMQQSGVALKEAAESPTLPARADSR
ncbi:MAG: ethanolamine ammonia-lyase subunit EutC [Alphaproteobacteria bacterium]|nr:ethanolamine ammonia-lyase subunit EutC [Alphaproteobacteria bacterium]